LTTASVLNVEPPRFETSGSTFAAPVAVSTTTGPGTGQVRIGGSTVTNQMHIDAPITPAARDSSAPGGRT